MFQRSKIAVLLMFSFGAVAQENLPIPKVSDASLTSEQIAVYRAVLESYQKGSQRVLNLANITEPLDQTDAACLTGLQLKATKMSASIVHRLSPSFVTDTKTVLVQSDRQQARIKENDPQALMSKAIDDHQKITEEHLDKSLNSAFDNGLFTLSEVAFDKTHHRAAVSYSFVCGGLCGNGNTLVLRKVGHNWKVFKRCGGWVS